MLSTAIIFTALTVVQAQCLSQPGAGTRGSSTSLPGDYDYAFREHPIRSIVASAPSYPPSQYSYNPNAPYNTIPVRCTYKPAQPHYQDKSGVSGYGAPCGYQSRCEGNRQVEDPQYYGGCGSCGSCGSCARGCQDSCSECGRPYCYQNQYYQNDYQLPRYDGSMYADGSKGFGKNLVQAPEMAPEPVKGTVDPYADGFLMPEVVGAEKKPERSVAEEKREEVYQGRGAGKLKGKIKNAMGKEASKGAMKRSRDGKGRKMGL